MGREIPSPTVAFKRKHTPRLVPVQYDSTDDLIVLDLAGVLCNLQLLSKIMFGDTRLARDEQVLEVVQYMFHLGPEV